MVVRGWCPGALRPMRSGDGLVLRVRPRLARLTRAQVLALCAVAADEGAGLIDLTNRANLQLRGLDEAGWQRALVRLAAQDLLDEDAGIEARRNVLVAPDWQPGDATERIARTLIARLSELPLLPAKFGIAVDAGKAPVLSNDSADLRIERTAGGGLLLRADGRAQGMPVCVDSAVSAVLALARWFADSGGLTAGRMRRHRAPLPAWAQGTLQPAPPRPAIGPGGPDGLGGVGTHRYPAAGTATATGAGLPVCLPFGQVAASTLAQAMLRSGAQAVRLTPWRVMLFEAADAQALASVLPDGLQAATWMQVDACAGAPHCTQATVATRALARQLATAVGSGLHVSGCAKGCARARPAAVCLTGRDGLFDLAFNARPGEPASLRGLNHARVLAHFGVLA